MKEPLYRYVQRWRLVTLVATSSYEGHVCDKDTSLSLSLSLSLHVEFEERMVEERMKERKGKERARMETGTGIGISTCAVTCAGRGGREVKGEAKKSGKERERVVVRRNHLSRKISKQTDNLLSSPPLSLKIGRSA